MEKIEVRKLDEVYFHLSCESGTSRELYQYFSKYTKNYQHDRRFKNRLWNGKINYFHVKDHTLPIGLLPDLIEFAKTYRYTLDYKFDVTTLYDKDFTKDKFLKYVQENLTLPFQPRDYQLDSVVKALKRKRGICLMPTSCLDKDTKIKVRVNKEDLELLKTMNK